MQNQLIRRLVVCSVATSIAVSITASITVDRIGAQEPLVERFLIEGKLAEGAIALEKHLADNPRDDNARFGLGTLQFLQAVEHLGQAMYAKGAKSPTGFLINEGIPLFRLPLPNNPDPEATSYQDVREILSALVDDLAVADATLAQIEEVGLKIPIHFGRVHLDLNGDGVAGADESLWRVYSVVNNRARGVTRADAEEFVISFDKADVHWLRGYCHLLSAIGDVALSFDFERLFQSTGHLFFARCAGVPDLVDQVNDGLVARVLDEVALLHCLDFEIVEPERLKSAQRHLTIVIEQSRESWAAIDAEMDDDREWIPGVAQTGVVPGVRISEEMIASWHRFLDEAEAILAGDLLIPYWRTSDEPWGVNLHRVFHEAIRFDGVLWYAGTGAAPYLEKGELSEPETWERFQQVFRGEFIGFAIWFN